jgi:hypothetical protein
MFATILINPRIMANPLFRKKSVDFVIQEEVEGVEAKKVQLKRTLSVYDLTAYGNCSHHRCRYIQYYRKCCGQWWSGGFFIICFYRIWLVDYRH